MTKYLLDTMIVSETAKRRKTPQVAAWLAGLAPEMVRVSAISFAEFERGIDRLPSGEKRHQLRLWADELPGIFAGRILDFDVTCARAWGAMEAAAGRTLPSRDAMIGATALTHGLVVATRNVRDFQRMSVPTFDPWSP